MKEKICCIIDSNEKYAVKFMEFCNAKHVLPYKMYAFTEADEFFNCFDEKEAIIVLAEDSLSPRLEEGYKGILVRLVEVQDTSDFSICRFQQADQIVNELLSYLGEVTCKLSSESHIYGVYSPATKCYKTTLAMAIAAHLGKNSRTLFISLEEFAGLDEVLPAQNGGLSGALYYYKTGKGTKAVSCTDSNGNFDYLRPSDCPDDTDCLTKNEFMNIINIFIECGRYKNIVIDIAGVCRHPWDVLEICDKIYTPEPLDYQGIEKLNKFTTYIEQDEKKFIKEKLISVRVPFIERSAGKRITIENIMCSEIQNVVGGIINA